MSQPHIFRKSYLKISFFYLFQPTNFVGNCVCSISHYLYVLIKFKTQYTCIAPISLWLEKVSIPWAGIWLYIFCGRQVVENWKNFKGLLMEFRKIFYRFLTCLLESCLKENNSTIQAWEFINVCVILLKIKSAYNIF